ncbi:glycosyltransferase [Acinetobacter portensis]|uniref:Glycosyltransferase n=1 Tax=Acinetobacter portensis TaxID=1839785 RepID=A0ABY4JVN2_9GAMM|nr:glycosyltransferase [Acinetobacter portensis]MCK7607978.1 glycosyltransferase [Acinetobacter portensis]MCK7638739.1 glycosyltransferase [Acinetobacter portensis]UPO23500.1 glycosyltransferase [Acinetobacter portensis]
MSILFIGKRFYTNRDAYTEKFGRIYQLPYYWSKETKTDLWLVDYHSKEKIKDQHEALKITSTPIFSFIFIIHVIKTLFVDRPKTIVASGDCYIGLFSFILAKICRAKFIFDVYDKYDAFTGYKNLGFKNLFQFLLKHADTCLFASKKLQHESELLCKKSLLVPNGIDTNLFYPRNKNQSRSFLNLDQNIIYVGYFGSMEIERGIDDLISAVKLLHEENSKIYILLGGKKRDDLNLEYEFIHFLGNVPFTDVPIAMACCDLLTLPYRNSAFLDHASSCKIGEYAAMNIPIVMTNSNHVLNNYKFKDHDLNYISKNHNPNDLAKAIKIILLEKHKFNILFSTWNDISKNII